MKPTHRLATLGLLASLALPLQGADEQILNVYNWFEYIAPDTIENFEKETGIRVNYTTFDSMELVETKLLTGQSGYDLVMLAGGNLEKVYPTGALAPIQRERLGNYANLDPQILSALSAHDPANRYGVPYTWGTTGLAYERAELASRLPGVATDDLALLLDPQYASALAECGIAMIDAPEEVLGIVLNYLGEDPYSDDPVVLKRAESTLMAIRPYITHMSTGQIIDDLANGNICLALTWSGEAALASVRAEEVGKGVEVVFEVPRQGSVIWFDSMVIPKDAAHPELAHRFIDYILKPQVMADITNSMYFANGNRAARAHVAPEILSDPGIYPPAALMERLFAAKAMGVSQTRDRNRLWRNFKKG
ncbi:extracellular solute-binding protein [Ferrimonas balearica]|uniref:extracellular solute-binding protein n=1 Tax=Ferrimonas balearica TaxID=44012 RepID=UPI001C9430EA|nr:extracellular solute-binding protein [Ferrimonas balearica]MBY6105331.1 extracellular solute-binding protein [Ferrimonas balearica]